MSNVFFSKNLISGPWRSGKKNRCSDFSACHCVPKSYYLIMKQSHRFLVFMLWVGLEFFRTKHVLNTNRPMDGSEKDSILSLDPLCTASPRSPPGKFRFFQKKTFLSNFKLWEIVFLGFLTHRNLPETLGAHFWKIENFGFFGCFWMVRFSSFSKISDLL